MDFNYQEVEQGIYDFSNNHFSLRKRWHDLKFSEGLKKIKIKDYTHLLDLGCGPGYFIEHYGNSVPMILGFDISRPQINHAKLNFSKPNVKFTDSKSEVNKFVEDARSGTLLVTCFEVIEHLNISELSELFSEISSKHNLKMTVLVTTPNKNSTWPIIEKLIDRLLGTNYAIQHKNLQSRKEAEKILISVFKGWAIKSGSYLSILHWLTKIRIPTYKFFTFTGNLNYFVLNSKL
jgi:2-polyprenyl-3-methyl-5-hydroxy-6-metoxy-1,4-benzoquinol methylase